MAPIDIVGGGILGLTMGLRLTQAGLPVRIWERAAEPGGLMGRIPIPEAGIECDRFYHAILSSDRALMALLDEAGIGASERRMVTTKMGFFHDGRCYGMSTPLEFLRFPPLSMIDRLRLAFTILRCRRIEGWRALDQIPVEPWLSAMGGQRAFVHIWGPLLRAKFDGGFDDVPATYIWSRLVRMTETRDTKNKTEQMVALHGGYMTLINKVVDTITAAGGEIHCAASVERIGVHDGQVTDLRVNGATVLTDNVVLTLPTPPARKLLSPEAAAADAQWSQLEDYLGIVCVLLVLRRSLSPYYTLNITDSRVPFTGVIETTNLIGSEHMGGYHLVYLPKYIVSSSVYARMPDDQLLREFLPHLHVMFPDFQEHDIVAMRVGRERFVEPLHPVGTADRIAPIASPVQGLFLANTTQIYPFLSNGEAVIRLAEQAAIDVSQSLAHVAPAGIAAEVA